MPHNLEKLEKLTKKLQTGERIIDLMLNNMPSFAMIITKDRRVVFANKKALENGAVVGDYCWKTFGHEAFVEGGSDKKDCDKRCSFCLADTAMNDFCNQRVPLLPAWGKVWDTHWIPIEGTDMYLHYAYDVTGIIGEEKREVLLSQPYPYGEK